jgi:hypothetical protein
MRQFWDAVLARFTVYIASAKPPDRPVAEGSFAPVKLETSNSDGRRSSREIPEFWQVDKSTDRRKQNEIAYPAVDRPSLDASLLFRDR